jgi:hypothetical protein
LGLRIAEGREGMTMMKILFGGQCRSLPGSLRKNTKSEARNTKQIQMAKIQMTETWKPGIDFAVFVLNIEKFEF